MGHSRSLRFRDAFSNFEYENSYTTYKGQRVTIAQMKALKAAETRKKNKEQKTDTITSVRNDVMDSLMEICRQSRAIRMLKSIRAYARNGEQQWGRQFLRFLRQNRDIKKHLYKFCTLYDEMDRLEVQIKKSLRKDARGALSLIEKYGYRLQDLLDEVTGFSTAVSKSGCSDMPLWKNHEIIKGSSDGKRVGISKIMGQMITATKKMETSIRKLAKSHKNAYEEINDL